jgi:hypothetical protein
MRALWLHYPNDSEAVNWAMNIFGARSIGRADRGERREIAPGLFARRRLV